MKEIQTSRIIVKNLPKEYAEKELREKFSCIPKRSTMLVTDVKLARTPTGQSRRFAFIGFSTNEEAAAAISYFDKTFFGSLKVSVEPAIPKSQTEFSDPSWKTSSGLENAEPKVSLQTEKALEYEEKKRKLFEIYQVSDKEAASNPQLLEFLASMKPRSQTKTWANDESILPNLVSSTIHSDDDLYEDLPIKSQPQEEPIERKTEVPLDFFRENFHSDRASREETRQLIKETGRLFLRSLLYASSSELLSKDLDNLLSPFGPIGEVYVPVSPDSLKPKGIAFVQFMLPEHALNAFESLNGTFFQGRILHICGAREKEVKKTDENTSFKATKETSLRNKSLKASETWNSLFLSSDSVMEAIARQLGVNKRSLLNPDLSSSDLASRVALAETQIILQTKKYFEEEGILLGANFDTRSKTTLLIKNLSYSETTEESLGELLKPFGSISRLLIPPTRAMAIVEYGDSTSAKAAFSSLAYRKFGSLPLFLEWAPEDLLQSRKTNEHSVSSKPKPAGVEDKESRISQSSSTTSTLFIKNLNFSTKKEDFEKLFSRLSGFISCSISTRMFNNKRVSAGFGFATFGSSETAQTALESFSLQNAVLDGHRLSISLGRDGSEMSQTSDVKSAKILVRNVAFEATAMDIRRLFSPFGQIKRIKVPKKHDGTHRGFCFIEFVSLGEAKAAFENVRHSHLYGRHLVLEWADDSLSADQKLKINSRVPTRSESTSGSSSESEDDTDL